MTLAITAPSHSFLGGFSCAFSTGSLSKLEQGAVVEAETAIHVSLAHGDLPSVSTEIAALRRLLLFAGSKDGDESLQKVVKVIVCMNQASVFLTPIHRERYHLSSR